MRPALGRLEVMRHVWEFGFCMKVVHPRARPRKLVRSQVTVRTTHFDAGKLEDSDSLPLYGWHVGDTYPLPVSQV